MIDIDDVIIELTDEDIKFIDSVNTMLSMTDATQKDLECSIALAFEMINKNKENSGNDDIRIGCSYGSSIKGIDDFINYKEYLRRKNNMKKITEIFNDIKEKNEKIMNGTYNLNPYDEFKKLSAKEKIIHIINHNFDPFNDMNSHNKTMLNKPTQNEVYGVINTIISTILDDEKLIDIASNEVIEYLKEIKK